MNFNLKFLAFKKRNKLIDARIYFNASGTYVLLRKNCLAEMLGKQTNLQPKSEPIGTSVLSLVYQF